MNQSELLVMDDEMQELAGCLPFPGQRVRLRGALRQFFYTYPDATSDDFWAASDAKLLRVKNLGRVTYTEIRILSLVRLGNDPKKYLDILDLLRAQQERSRRRFAETP